MQSADLGDHTFHLHVPSERYRPVDRSPQQTPCLCVCAASAVVWFRWYVPGSAGPSDDGPSTQLWVYRSTVDPVGNTQAGLAGPLVIARPGGLDKDGKPADVDREIYLMLQVSPECQLMIRIGKYSAYPIRHGDTTRFIEHTP